MTADLRCGDAFALLHDLQDVTIADPPYDEQTHEGARYGEGGKAGNLIDFAPITPEDVRRVTGELLRVTRRWVILFCSLEQIGAYRDAAGPCWIRSGVWVKPDAMPQITGDRPAQGAEGIAILHRLGRKRWHGGGRPARWTFGIERTDRVHPTQKPLRLLLALLEDFSDPGELVLDPFAGSGTTAVAALRLGRRFLGTELRPDYHAMALERIAAEGQGQSLTAMRAGQRTLFGADG